MIPCVFHKRCRCMNGSISGRRTRTKDPYQAFIVTYRDTWAHPVPARQAGYEIVLIGSNLYLTAPETLLKVLHGRLETP